MVKYTYIKGADKMYFQYYIMGIILLPGLIFAMWAQSKVNGAFREYSGVNTKMGVTAGRVIERFVRQSGMDYITINKISGHLTDNFNPMNKTINLSQSVYDSSSIAAIGVATHEFGHALQQKEHYAPYVLRRIVIPVSNIASYLLWPLVIIGLVLNVFVYAESTLIGDIFLWSGIGFFGLSVLLNLITLPVEYNASHRALKLLEDSGTMDDEELSGAREVLNSAALTYVAALVVAILNFLRFILVVTRYSRRR